MHTLSTCPIRPRRSCIYKPLTVSVTPPHTYPPVALLPLLLKLSQLSGKKILSKYAERRNPKLRRHPHRHPLASSWCLPQVWLPCGILALFVADHLWLHPWDYLRHLCHHQVIPQIISVVEM